MKKSEVLGKINKNKQNFKYSVDVTNLFKKDLVACFHSGFKTDLLIEAVEILAIEGKLPLKYKPHKLEGSFKGYWECHIQSDWLMIWKQTDSTLTLMLTNTGTHAYIFGI